MAALSSSSDLLSEYGDSLYWTLFEKIYTPENSDLLNKLLANIPFEDIALNGRKIINLYQREEDRELIDKLISYKIDLYDILSNFSRFKQLYIKDNIDLIDSWFPAKINLFNISEYGEELIELYFLNIELIKRLIADRIHVHDIITYGEELIDIYTQENKELIDRWLCDKTELYVIITIGRKFIEKEKENKEEFKEVMASLLSGEQNLKFLSLTYYYE